MTELSEFDTGEVARVQRMRECHAADKPARGEVLRALARIKASPTRSRGLRVRRALLAVAAVPFLALGALAAVKTRSAELAPPPQAVEQRADARRGAAPKRLRLERAGKLTEAREPTTLSLLPGERVALFVDDHETDFIGPGVLNVTRGSGGNWVTHFEPRGWPAQLERAAPVDAPSSSTSATGSAVPSRRALNQPATSGKANASPAPHAVSNDRSGLWSEAANALRTGDRARADKALHALGESADVPTREAALLARAELDLGAGSKERGLEGLATLAESATTPFVRQRARQILESQR